MKQDFRKIIKDVGLKNTIPRLLILETLFQIKSPETAQEIHKNLKKYKMFIKILIGQRNKKWILLFKKQLN